MKKEEIKEELAKLYEELKKIRGIAKDAGNAVKAISYKIDDLEKMLEELK